MAHVNLLRRFALILSMMLGLAVVTPTAGVTSDVSVQHLTSTTVAEVGRTRVIMFRLESAPAADVDLVATVEPAGLVSIERAPTVMAGHALGSLRIRGIAPGRAMLTVGDAALRLDVVPPRRPRLADTRPRIVGPSEQAYVWGTVSVGVEMLIGDQPAPTHLELRFHNGATITRPIGDDDIVRPHVATVFDVKINSFPAGPLHVTPVAIAADGTEAVGPAVGVTVIHPDPTTIRAGEAEAQVDIERPQRFRDDRVNIGRHIGASGGKYFSNAGSYPAVCIPVSVESPGRYQMMLVASGTRAQGALPTVGVVVNGENQPRTNGRLLSESWHRVAIGVPFRLESGVQIVTPFFENDFFVPRLADRNLRLDRYEIVRVADAADGAASDGMGMGMAMGMATPGPTTRPAAATVTRTIEDPYALADLPVRLGLVGVYDGLDVAAALRIQARLWWRGANNGAVPPPVTLVINGRDVATQRTGAPLFWVDPSEFDAGENIVHLEVRLGSDILRTPPQRMTRMQEAVVADAARRRFPRFTVHDRDRWTGLEDKLRAHRNPSERVAAVFASAGEATLDLPEDLTGTFGVQLEVLGEEFEGLPLATVTLRTPDGEFEIGEVEARTWWEMRPAGEVLLPEGPKQLVIAFTNDHYEADKGDRNLLFQSVLLSEQFGHTDRSAPIAEITYPPDGHDAWMQDAVIARVADDLAVQSAELLVDGVRTGVSEDLRLKPGPVVFPLLLRNLEPGEHQVAVEVRDSTGNLGRSAPRTITVPKDAPEHPGTYERAVHLLNRFAFGPDQRELAAILTMGEDAWLDARLGASFESPGDLTALGAGMVHFAEVNQYTVPRRELGRLLLSPNPVRARFVLWSQNHFSTWLRKVDAVRKWDEHVRFSQAGVTTFDRLLETSATSPAMLGYLDQDVSFVGRLNENYAREILELHTLGVHGGYAQEDVTRLAGLLTGWTAAQEGDGRSGGQRARTYEYRFDADLNDGRPTDILGHRFAEAAHADRYDRVRLALELLAAHPSTARFVSTKLAEHYVGAPPPEQLVDDLTVTFLETYGDTAALLRRIAAHPDFWASRATPRLAPPLDYVVRLCRTTRHYQPWQVGDFLQSSGTGLFDRATPDGYPEEDAAYADSNAMVQRWRQARRMMWPLMNCVPGQWRWGRDGLDEVWAQRVVDVIAVRLTGRVLGERSNGAAVDLLLTTPGTRDQRVRAVAPFIAQVPEANLR